MYIYISWLNVLYDVNARVLCIGKAQALQDPLGLATSTD